MNHVLLAKTIINPRFQCSTFHNLSYNVLYMIESDPEDHRQTDAVRNTAGRKHKLQHQTEPVPSPGR